MSRPEILAQYSEFSPGDLAILSFASIQACCTTIFIQACGATMSNIIRRAVNFFLEQIFLFQAKRCSSPMI